MDRELTMDVSPAGQSSPTGSRYSASKHVSSHLEVALAFARPAVPQQPPVCPPETVHAVVAEQYGFEGTLRRLGSGRGETYRLQTGDQPLLVKVSAPGEPREMIELQVAAISHVSGSGRLPVPRIRHTLAGEPVAAAPPVDGCPGRLVHIMDFLPGEDLAARPLTVSEADRVGQVHGEVTLALADFAHPHQSRRFIWDLAALPAIAALRIGTLHDRSRERLAAQVLDAFEREVLPLTGQFDEQVVHGDFSVHNVLADRSHPGFVTGIVDFGDLHRGAIVVDLAIAVSNLIDHRLVDPWFTAAAHVRGFLHHQQIPPHHREAIASAAAARSLQRALLSEWQAQMQPDRAAYVLAHARDEWSNIAAACETIRNGRDHFVNPD